MENDVSDWTTLKDLTLNRRTMSRSHSAEMVHDTVEPVGGPTHLVRLLTEAFQGQGMLETDKSVVPHKVTPTTLEALQVEHQNPRDRFKVEAPMRVLVATLWTSPFQLATVMVILHRLRQQILQRKKTTEG